MEFTETDKNVMNIILKYKNGYDTIQQKSLQYKFNITSENIGFQNMYISVENVDTHEINGVKSIPYFIIVDNTLRWVNDSIRNSIKDDINQIANLYHFSEIVKNTLLKFTISRSIVFDNEYKYIIPIFIALIANSDICNIIRFEPVIDDNHMTAYHMMYVPIRLPAEILTTIDDIFKELKNF